MTLMIKQRAVSEVVVLDVTGRLWILDLPLRDLMNGLLADGKRHFVVNLAGVDYMDSSGLGQLVSIWTSIRNKNGYLTLLNPSKRVRRLFEITRLHTVFEVFEQEPAAVEKARKAKA
ncbi:MAG: anti-sigma factor antagonist [Acidobacteria bacterium]|nr:MAG: anti-sigma factor antagonist [Acidobacteriota bacterium]